MRKFFKQSEKGFTLVETLVAVSIFSMSVLGLLSILSQGIADTRYARDKIIAAYLTQEGIEYIRNMRDTFSLYDATSAEEGWNNFHTKVSPCISAGGCYFDDRDLNYTSHTQPMTGITLIPCESSCPNLLYDDITGKYGYVAGRDTGFSRKILISSVNANELKVFSTISWAQGSGNFGITFSEDLFNWIQ